MPASFIKSGTNLKTMKRSWPSVYLTGGKHFNLTAILQSGEFYLDEAGLLVAPNGTRYRIPSGPPEGRKPLRVDRPRQNLTVESEKSRTDPILNPLGDSYSVEQEDFSTFAHVNPAQKQNPTNWSKYSNRQMIGTTFHLPAHSASWPLTTSSPSSGNDFQAIDWNIVLLTIVLSSVALICNLGLVFLLSWRLRQMRKRTMNINGEMSWGAEEDVQNYKCYVPNLQESSEDDWMNRTERGGGGQMRMNVNSQKQFNDQLMPSRINDRFRYANFPSRRQRYHRRHYSRRGRMRGRLKYATNTYGGTSRFSEQEYNDPPTIRRRVQEFDDQAERRSNSIRSFQGGVVSDGVLSETTGDDEESTTESGNNSDVPVHSRRRYSGGRPHSQVPPLRGWHYRSDSTPDEVDRMDSYSSDSQTRKPDLSARSRPSYLDTIRSVERQSFGNSNDETYFLDKSFDTSVASKLPPFNIRLCHTLGIHLGLLGTVLSLVQIVTLCSALNSRFQSGGSRKDLQLSEFVCVLSTSLAADTILCARLYLIAAFLFVFWTTLYMAVVSRTGRLKEHSFPALCFALTASREHVTNHKSPGQITHSPTKQSVNENQTTGSRRQQRYAYLALMHSLPWAISAGTALLITFALYNTLADLNTFSENGRNERSQVKLNLFFKGLDSLLVCTMDTAHRTGYRTKFSVDSQKTTYSPITSTRAIISDKSFPESWISAFLLVLIPLMLHLLICFVCSVLLRANFTHQSGSKSVHRKTDKQICGSLCSIFFLILTESLSCGLPVIWAMTNPYDSFSRDSRSTLIYRLIIAHFFIDPWVVAWMLHSIMHHITPSLPPNGSMSQFLQRNRTGSLNSVENQVYTNGEDPLKPGILLKEKSSSASRPSVSPGTFMGCVPVCECASSQSNEEVLEAPVSHHPMFMSCMPGAGLYLPPISQLPPSPLEATNNVRPAIGTTGFLVPITNVSMAISVSGPANSTILRMQPSNPNIFNNRGAGASPPSMGTDTSTPSRSLGSAGHHTLHEVFPQLCEHHQQLLEQHFKPKPPKPGSEELRKFGLVPRLNQPTVSFTDSLMMMTPLSKTDPEKTVKDDAAGESRAELKTVATVEGLDEPLKLAAAHRPLSGKSPATAAVMAAAAAAVAAQAGNMSRTMEENPPHGTSGKSNNE